MSVAFLPIPFNTPHGNNEEAIGDLECPICLRAFQEEEEIVAHDGSPIAARHPMHRECIGGQISYGNRECGLCRSKISNAASLLPPGYLITQAAIGAISCFAGVFLERLAEEGDGVVLGSNFGLSSSFLIPLCAFSISRIRQISPSFSMGGFCGYLTAIALNKVVGHEQRLMSVVIRCASAMCFSAMGADFAVKYNSLPGHR